MSDVLRSSATLRENIEALRDAKKTSAEIQRLHAVQQSLDDVVSDVRRYAEFLVAVSADGARVGAVPSSLRRAAAEARALTAAPDSDSERLATSVAELRDELAKLRTQVEEAARDAWRDLAAEVAIEDQMGLFKTLRMIPKFRQQADDLILFANSVRAQLAERKPPSAAAYRILRRNLATLAGDIGKLKVADLPELEGFLLKCVRSEATLADLLDQPRILEWIADQGLEAHFLLRPK